MDMQPLKCQMKGILNCQTIQKVCSRHRIKENSQCSCVLEIVAKQIWAHSHRVCMRTPENQNSPYRVKNYGLFSSKCSQILHSSATKQTLGI